MENIGDFDMLKMKKDGTFERDDEKKGCVNPIQITFQEYFEQ